MIPGGHAAFPVGGWSKKFSKRKSHNERTRSDSRETKKRIEYEGLSIPFKCR
jgi:hypothetical protein